jgi:hypothetical protein
MDIQVSEDSGDSTYGSELVASRIATELFLEIRYKLQWLRLALDGPSLMLGDNMSVFLNSTVPSSVLKENAMSYNQERKAIVERTMRFSCIKNEENVSDILTKYLSNK